MEVGNPAVQEGNGSVTELWVYTSIYQEVLDAMAPALAADLPDLEVRFFQGGSEKVAQRWEAEHAAGGSRACLVATSDPGWYLDLHARGELRPYVTPRALRIDRTWVHEDYAAFRLGFMVMASSAPEGPASFHALADPRWKDQFSSGDPLASGTTFTTLAAWEQAFGSEWLRAVRGNGWIAAGGNGAVITRMESGERRVGVVLLENLLAKPGVARLIVPEEGAVAIPGMLAIPRDCPTPAAATRLYDWFFAETAQRALIAGNMYSPFPDMPPPVGAPPLAELPRFHPEADLLGYMAENTAAIKERYQAAVSGRPDPGPSVPGRTVPGRTAPAPAHPTPTDPRP